MGNLTIGKDFRIQRLALEALQEATEAVIVDEFASELCLTVILIFILIKFSGESLCYSCETRHYSGQRSSTSIPSEKNDDGPPFLSGGEYAIWPVLCPFCGGLHSDTESYSLIDWNLL